MAIFFAHRGISRNRKTTQLPVHVCYRAQLISSSYDRSARDHNCQRLKSKYCDKTVNAQAGSHVCIWRESARALTHVLKHTVSIGYHKEKTRNTSAYSLSASTIYHHRILQFRNNLTRLWDNPTKLWVCAG